MQYLFWLLIAWVLLAALWRKARVYAVERLAARALVDGDVRPVVEAVGSLGEALRPDAFDAAVGHLWRRGARPLAVALVRQCAPLIGPAFATQFWIREGLEHAPEAARDHFDDDFLEAIYEPPVRQACATYG